MMAPIPQMQLETANLVKEVPVSVHLFENDTLGVAERINELDAAFLPYGFTFYLDTLTFTDVDTTWYGAYYHDSVGLPPYSYSIFTAMSEPLHRDGTMNVYVLPYLAANIAGFAWVPPYMNGTERHPADGIWIREGSFLTTTLHHEVGHFLGLYHVFQNVSFCGQDADLHDFEGNLYGDLVRDTPPTKLSYSCSENCPTSYPETRPWYDYVHNNFMDYYPCRSAFTEQQAARMHAYMAVYRSSEYNDLSLLQGDINGDGIIGTLDLLKVLECLGPVVVGCEDADFDTNEIVGVFDLLVLLSNYGL